MFALYSQESARIATILQPGDLTDLLSTSTQLRATIHVFLCALCFDACSVCVKCEKSCFNKMKSATSNLSAPPGPPKLAPKPGSVKVMRALYKYVAQYPDELSFQEGDILYVFDQVSDPNWWKARCGNQTGLIPSNYVENQVEEVQTPLHEAARRGNLNFLQECLSQGVSGTGLDQAGNTPLYWACHAGHIDCVKELLALANPAVNAQNKIGDTPLHSAAARGHLSVVELLLESGADSTIKNKDGDTAVDLSMNSAITNCIQQKRSNYSQQRANVYSVEDYEDDSD